MAILIKMLPFLLVIGWLWWTLTANTRLERSLRKMSRPLNDWSLVESVQSFSKALDSKPFDVKILDLEPVNAIALSSGEVYIWRGLYEKYLSGAATRDEISAVIAHEIGHVALGHARRRVETSRAQIALLAVAGFLFGRLLFGWWALLAGLGLGMLNGREAQRQEFEADAFAAQMLMRVGVDPRSTVTILRKVEQWGGRAPDQPIPLRWLMTHPPIDERIAYLEQVIAAGLPKSSDEGSDGARQAVV